jgi:hypothetical protein
MIVRACHLRRRLSGECEDPRVIRHLVLFKLVDPADAPETVERLHALRGRCAGLRTMDAGADVLGTEASYDVGLVSTYDDLAGLQAYVADPVHQEFLAWLKPRLAARVVVDSEH